MKSKLVITLTTVHGSHQYTLGQIAKYLAALFLVLAALSFFISNGLLMITQDSLEELEQNHEQLQAEYEEIAESSQQAEQLKNELSKLKQEMDTLAVDNERFLAEVSRLREIEDNLTSIESERNLLAQENEQMEDAVGRLVSLEDRFGLSGEGKSTSERVKKLNAEIDHRNFLLFQIPSGSPLKKTAVTAKFGFRTHPVYKKRKMHNGIDFRAAIGTPIYATADGIVEFAGRKKSSGFGKLIVLQHNYGFKTYYAHLDKVKVKSRSFVSKGQLIGYTGNSGISTGPHLHYEVHHLYKRLDPKPFVTLSMVNVNKFFKTVKSVQWASLKNLYPQNQKVLPLQ